MNKLYEILIIPYKEIKDNYIYFESPYGPYESIVIGLKIKRTYFDLSLDYPINKDSCSWDHSTFKALIEFNDVVDGVLILLIKK